MVNSLNIVFSPLPKRLTPPRGADLWLLDLTDADQLIPPNYAAVLSADDIARSQLINRNKSRFLVTRLLLRKTLAHYTGMAPQELNIVRAAGGKPFLANAARPLYFNLSHTSAYAILAVSAQADLGVDVETIRTRDFMNIAQRYFHANEVQQLLACDGAEREALFYRQWTLKEAFFKATGGGISTGLDKVCFTIAAEKITAELSPSLNLLPHSWQFQQRLISPNTWAALACNTEHLVTQWLDAKTLLTQNPDAALAQP